MRILKENKVVDAVVDYVFGLTKEDLISFEEADNFVNLLAQGEVDDADEYMVFDCANGSPLGNEDCAVNAIKSYFKESKKPSKKRMNESFDNPIDEIIMPYTCWSSIPLRSDADAMAENAKEAAEELSANGFTAEEVKAHFDEDGYYDAVNGVAEGNGVWDRAFANCILANLKESKKNSKKRMKENANLDDVYYVVLSCPIQCDEYGNPEDWSAVELFDADYAKFEAKARELGMNEVCWDDGDAESGPIIKGAGIFYGPVEKIRDLVDEGFDIEVYENCQDEQPYELTGRIYDVNSLVYDANEPLTEGFISNAISAAKCLRLIPMLLTRLRNVSNYSYWVDDLKAGYEKPVNEGTMKSFLIEEIKNWAKESRKNYDLLKKTADKAGMSLGSLISYFAQATIDAERKTLLKKFKKNMPLSDEEINALDEDDVTLRSIPSYKSLRESELDDLVNKPFSELVNDFLNKLVVDGLLEEDVKEIFITDFKNANEPEDIDIDLLYDGVGADPHDPVNQEMFAEIAKMIEDAYQFKDEWAGIDESDMVDEDDPLYGYGEDDLNESVKKVNESMPTRAEYFSKEAGRKYAEETIETEDDILCDDDEIKAIAANQGADVEPFLKGYKDFVTDWLEIDNLPFDGYDPDYPNPYPDEEDDPDEIRDMGEMYGVPRGATSEEALKHFESRKAPNKKGLKEDRSLGRTPKDFKDIGRGTTVLDRDGEPWTVAEKGSVGELNRKYPECEIFEKSYYHAVYVVDPICDYNHEDRGKHIFVYGDYDDVYNNVLAYWDDVPTRSWSVYMRESKKAPNRKTLKEDAIAKDRVGIEIKSSKGWVWASKDGLKPGAPLEYKNEKAAKSSKEWKTFLDKYGEENLRVSEANN